MAERSYYSEQFELNKQIDFLIENQYVSDNSTIANSFNNYFTNIRGWPKQLNLISTL